ncbi:hypothetical protein ACQKEK_02480 [Pseudomonas sp. NPDC077408]|uniref:hypothetical protein n=1 Tax=Streptomyces parvus TaxID=66428 RepID=UPI0037240334
MTEQEVLAVIKRNIREQMNTYGYDIAGRTDQEALERFGSACSSTALILIAITGGYHQKTARLYRFLEGMRERGLLMKQSLSGGQCKWWPVGFADELRDTPDATPIAPYRAETVR